MACGRIFNFHLNCKNMLVFCFLLFSFLYPLKSHAWMISHGFNKPCHETMAIQSYEYIFKNVNMDRIHVPNDEASRKIYENICGFMDLEKYDNEEQCFLIASMVLGVRQPDTDGHAMLNFNEGRAMHVTDESQSNHTLRTTKDDWEEGNIRSIYRARKRIEDNLSKVKEYANVPEEQQYIKVEQYIEFYGPVDIIVFAPVYYMGIAMHIFQDSFSHTIRSDDLRLIYHVMNYTDAASPGHDEERDGFAHSVSMDDCFGDAWEIAEATTIATGELVRAVYVQNSFGLDGANQVDQVLDNWMTYKEGCNIENDYCESKWLELAQKRQTAPILEEIFGCRMGNKPVAFLFIFLLLLPLLLILRNSHSQQD